MTGGAVARSVHQQNDGKPTNHQGHHSCVTFYHGRIVYIGWKQRQTYCTTVNIHQITSRATRQIDNLRLILSLNPLSHSLTQPLETQLPTGIAPSCQPSLLLLSFAPNFEPSRRDSVIARTLRLSPPTNQPPEEEPSYMSKLALYTPERASLPRASSLSPPCPSYWMLTHIQIHEHNTYANPCANRENFMIKMKPDDR